MKRSLLIYIALFMICTLFIPSITHADQVHRIAPGETLYLVAAKYGVTTNALIQHNLFLKNPNTLFPNQALIVPEVSPTITYQVQAGDSLYKISQKLGVSMTALAETNQLKDWNTLYVGQILSVPPNISNSYTVKSGDTLYLISQKLGVSITDLSKENNLTNLDYLYVGQVLKVPVSKPNHQTPGLVALFNTLAEKYPKTLYYKGSSVSRRIALTFDDGPDEVYTPQILDILKAHNAKATFFLIGSKVTQHPELVNRIISEGHTIGNHTWTHPDLRKVANEQLISEIKQTEDAIKSVSGLTTAIMRPPYGAVNDSVTEQLQELNYKVIGWNADSVDWKQGITPDQILINTLTKVSEDTIVLMHDSPGNRSATVKALPDLLTTLSKNGYTFVTSDEILDIEAYK